MGLDLPLRFKSDFPPVFWHVRMCRNHSFATQASNIRGDGTKQRDRNNSIRKGMMSAFGALQASAAKLFSLSNAATIRIRMLQWRF